MRRSWILPAIVALVAVACSTGDTTTTTEAPAETTTSPTEAPAETTTTRPVGTGGVLMVADSSLGPVVVDGDGNTLYLFVPDNQGESACYDECEANWPPLVDSVLAADGIDASLLGTAARTDGSEQVTYNGWPLYYFAGDASPGDTNGQGINEVWYVVDPRGEAIGLGG